MDNSKHRKLRTIQMKYPAPYSQSWSNTEPVPESRGRMKKCLSFQANRQKQYHIPQQNCCWQRPKPLTHGSDPYAPHLKYGLFPRKVFRENIISTTNKPFIGKNVTPIEEIHLNAEKFKTDNRKKQAIKGHLSEAPLFVIRPIDKQFTRQLSMSGVTHVDIKPRRNILLTRRKSPIRPLSPRISKNFVRNKFY